MGKRNSKTVRIILTLPDSYFVLPSTSDTHDHIYLNVVLTNLKWFWLMWGLWQAGVIELGFFVWSIRRGGNFVRTPYTRKKQDSDETVMPSYGWFFKLREKK